MVYVFLFGVWEDKDVIEVDDAVYIQQITEGMIYIYLEYDWSIDKSKWHDCILEVSIPGLEGCHPFFALFDLNVVVCIPQVQLSIYLSAG